MKSLIVKLLLLIAFCPIFAQAQETDTLLKMDELEFVDGSVSEAQTDTVVSDTTQVVRKSEAIISNSGTKGGDSLFGIFLAGFIGGFAALLMPCIFPMLPLTVSFFTKGSQNRSKSFIRALFYGISIIVIYVVLGLAVTMIFGSDALNALSTNGIFNFFFFLMLIAFGASFLGAFEISLPSSWVNKMDAKSDEGGWAGIFFMAATLALVSFSCTGPIIGTLLVQAATSGALLGPAVGMFGFSLALAIPFALFALFPSAMKAMPKSGGWLNSVKVVLGFLELAFALKFLSNVDLAYHWNWFDREVFLSLWIVIFGLMGFYLLGKIKFSHDSNLPYLSVLRTFFAIIVLSFTVYMIPGLWGAPLKSISAFLPPQSTQDFDLNQASGGTTRQVADVSNRKYADLFHAPLGLNVFFDYEEGMEYAKAQKKMVMLDFTGHACVNCRKMEANVWTDPQVLSFLTNNVIIIQLYVDDRTELAVEDQQKTSAGKLLKTIGSKWSYLQASQFESNSQPFYVLMNSSNRQVLVKPKGADYDPITYLNYLNEGLAAFVKLN
ncbi:protein-disulfide reductase DsbD family protein [Sphingobacterium faecium]|uniref:protein-disulfide reductase DsbD family protein n=1 Tax=Sphingobacterium faecium TaxID=34087 RepID=UPI00097F5F37|nr:cytochrome c biogenesis protein CcdA [Sphingobacterium faecium]WGQ15295.1 cytochrome c biogenesis protein CcdA [Sphingobacterium faecium]SJN52484.1 Cytochrome c-type biogenesis protein DsbD, protein-disulfide reductase [Sphingobacterium faecium PCAi_F2.5]